MTQTPAAGRAEITRPMVSAFRRIFNGSNELQSFRAPGRVNLIGEHTDYNEGFVMPAAIGFETIALAAPRPDRRLVVHSLNVDETRTFDLDGGDGPTGTWSDYVRGVAAVLEGSGRRLCGADLLVSSDVPLGSGLSSSAALEVSTALALLGTSGIELDRLEVARLCQQAENEFVGMRCGIMDQFVSCFGRAGHAVMLDCRSLEHRAVPLPAGVRLVICNSMVKHSLAGSEYNTRRAECEAGVRHFAGSAGKVASLRDVTVDDLERHGAGLDEVVRRRCRHVITENARVEGAAAALVRGDLATVGRLMAESHRSLRDDYEVSCAELDLLVSLADTVNGVYGSRMTGGGFGGCTVHLVRGEQVDEVRHVVGTGYEEATGRKPDIHVCEASDGAGRLDVL